MSCIDKDEAIKKLEIELAAERYTNGLYEQRIKEKDARIKKLEDGLTTIRDICDEEIKARSAGLSERALQNMKVLSLLIVPRNIARNALEGE